jgi:hypothetical protein
VDDVAFRGWIDQPQPLPNTTHQYQSEAKLNHSGILILVRRSLFLLQEGAIYPTGCFSQVPWFLDILRGARCFSRGLKRMATMHELHFCCIIRPFEPMDGVVFGNVSRS